MGRADLLFRSEDTELRGSEVSLPISVVLAEVSVRLTSLQSRVNRDLVPSGAYASSGSIKFPLMVPLLYPFLKRFRVSLTTVLFISFN